MIWNVKRELEKELSEIYDRKSKGAQIRSRAQWVSEGEQNSKYFLSLESKHQTTNIIKELSTENEEIVSSENDILGEMCFVL